MDDAVDEVIRQVATQHGVAIGRDDPILMMVTIQKIITEKTTEAQSAMLERHKEELEGIAQRWGSDAKEKAERILTAALSASKEAMASAMKASAAEAAAAMRVEVDAASGKLAAILEKNRYFAMMSLIASGCTIGTAIVLLWAFLKH